MHGLLPGLMPQAKLPLRYRLAQGGLQEERLDFTSCLTVLKDPVPARPAVRSTELLAAGP
jgi:hypothetical protein